MRTALAVALVAVAATACGARFHTTSHLADVCLDQPAIAAELARVDRSPPLVGARILDTLGAEIAARGEHGWACAGELADAITEQTLAQWPLPATRMLVARIRAVGELQDFVGVMARKSKLLVAIATLDEDRLTPYQPVAGEHGRGPTPAWIRSLAVRYLAHGNLYLNDGPARALLVQRLAESTDDRELLALTQVFDYMLFGGADRARAMAILRGFPADARRRLAAPPDPLSLELALFEVHMLGAYAGEAHADAGALLDAIIAVRGDVPAAHGAPGAADDLLIAAVAARARIAAGGVGHNAATPEPATPIRVPPEVWREASRDEPAVGVVPVADARARVRELRAQLQPGAHQPPCRPTAELARALPAADAEAGFDESVASMYVGGKLWVSDHSLCALTAALGMEQVPAARRRALILRVLGDGPTGFSISGGDYGNSDTSYMSLEAAIGIALAEHPAWIDDDAGLRAWLLRDADRSLVSSDNIAGLFDPEGAFALERDLPRAIVHAAAHDDETRRAAVATWIAELHAAATTRPQGRHLWFDTRLRLVAVWAARTGQADEAAALFASLTGTVDAARGAEAAAILAATRRDPAR